MITMIKQNKKKKKDTKTKEAGLEAVVVRTYEKIYDNVYKK